LHAHHQRTLPRPWIAGPSSEGRHGAHARSVSDPRLPDQGARGRLSMYPVSTPSPASSRFRPVLRQRCDATLEPASTSVPQPLPLLEGISEIDQEARLWLTDMQPGSSKRLAGSYCTERLLFLDVDGVLNCLATCSSPSAIVTEGWPCPLAPALLRRLRRVLEATGALVVLSSAWRMQEISRVALAKGLLQVGIPLARIVGSTPYLPGRPRAHEVLQWLECYGPPAAWTAVDDLDLWSEAPLAMEGHAVRTYIKSGLTEAAARETVSHLRVGAEQRGGALKQHALSSAPLPGALGGASCAKPDAELHAMLPPLFIARHSSCSR